MDNSEKLDLVVILEAPNEYTASLVAGLLEAEQIPCLVQSNMVPWMDGVLVAGEGHWGVVLVPREHSQRSKEIVDSYLAGI